MLGAYHHLIMRFLSHDFENLLEGMLDLFRVFFGVDVVKNVAPGLLAISRVFQ